MAFTMYIGVCSNSNVYLMILWGHLRKTCDYAPLQDSIPGTLCMHKSRSNRLEELFFIRIHDTTLYFMQLCTMIRFYLNFHFIPA